MTNHFQDDIEKRGRKHGHALGSWHMVELDLAYVPPLPELSEVDYRAPRARVECSMCGAWAALLTPDGIQCNSREFDAPCSGPRPRSPGDDMSYNPSKRLLDQIDRAFTFHPPKVTQTDRYELIRAEARKFALLVASLTPESREQSLAVTHLEEAVMWANAAIARNETRDT